ncbi:poly(beta-D-mannuronate) lyase [Bryocella elongata]|uniref:Poly(Beta-D-mannuronate) lyase n=1 Tax=Bryocella elongata TaxID=863522 RepID=A0A1H6C7W5_9BACT|nr:alginate lyase family protein [Bryocella elongata]SEG68993.1 poly(beta-D-mannuronate) lyase [Bryocella elongata]
MKIAITALAVMMIAVRAEGAPLRSPWSLHPRSQTTVPYACPSVPNIAADFVTDGFYADNDPTHSIIDPIKMKAYSESSGPVKHEGDVVVAAADTFRKTGSAEAARCVIAHLDSLSRQGSLTGKLSSSQAYFVQGWVSGAWAVAYLKVDGDKQTTAEQRAHILPWLKLLGAKTEAYYDERAGTNGGAQNHFYWAAVQLAATGIAANDRSEFDWAMHRAKIGIDAIAADGTLPEEMRRGKRALHYHLYAASPLVMLAELGLPNGVDLYAENSGALKRLVEVSTSGLVDASLFANRTGIAQERPDPPTAEAIGWAAPYVRRFPDPTITKLLAEAPDHSYMYLGGLPPE